MQLISIISIFRLLRSLVTYLQPLTIRHLHVKITAVLSLAFGYKKYSFIGENFVA